MILPEHDDLSTPSSTRARRLPPGMIQLERPMTASTGHRPARRAPDLLFADLRGPIFFSGPNSCTWVSS